MSTPQDFNPYSPPSTVDGDRALPAESRAHEYRSASTYVTVLTCLFALRIVIGVVGLGLLLVELELVQRLVDGHVVTRAEREASDARLQVVRGVATLLFFVIAVVFLMWMYRANRNARALGAVGMRFTPGWTVGYWFVPFLNFIRPFEAAQELWLASDPAVGPEDASWKEGWRSQAVEFWWIALLLVPLLDYLYAVLSARADSLTMLVRSTWSAIAVNASWVVAAILAIVIVRGIHARQEIKHDRVQQHSPDRY